MFLQSHKLLEIAKSKIQLFFPNGAGTIVFILYKTHV